MNPNSGYNDDPCTFNPAYDIPARRSAPAAEIPPANWPPKIGDIWDVCGKVFQVRGFYGAIVMYPANQWNGDSYMPEDMLGRIQLPKLLHRAAAEVTA